MFCLCQKKLDLLQRDIMFFGDTIQRQVLFFEARLRKAFHEAKYSLVIRELDSSRSSLLEGMFAFVLSIFSNLVEEFDPTILPGYCDALEQTIIARRGIAAFIRTTDILNDKIQDSSTSPKICQQEIEKLVRCIDHFIDDPVFYSLQAPDRWEIVNFKEVFQASSFHSMKQSSEGLSKYLTSLHMLNQSELLQQYDENKIQEIHELIESAQAVLQFSLYDAAPLLKRALETTQQLKGRNPYTDTKLELWEKTPPSFDTLQKIQNFITQLQEVIK